MHPPGVDIICRLLFIEVSLLQSVSCCCCNWCLLLLAVALLPSLLCSCAKAFNSFSICLIAATSCGPWGFCSIELISSSVKNLSSGSFVSYRVGKWPAAAIHQHTVFTRISTKCGTYLGAAARSPSHSYRRPLIPPTHPQPRRTRARAPSKAPTEAHITLPRARSCSIRCAHLREVKDGPGELCIANPDETLHHVIDLRDQLFRLIVDSLDLARRHGVGGPARQVP